jgi:transcriptional regulator with XRE-family HTH domain
VGKFRASEPPIAERKSQVEFARRIGVTQGYLFALEHGEKEPGSAVLVAISREFGKSIDRLLTEVEAHCD